jgi:hypothetical protein
VARDHLGAIRPYTRRHDATRDGERIEIKACLLVRKDGLLLIRGSGIKIGLFDRLVLCVLIKEIDCLLLFENASVTANMAGMSTQGARTEGRGREYRRTGQDLPRLLASIGGTQPPELLRPVLEAYEPIDAANAASSLAAMDASNARLNAARKRKREAAPLALPAAAGDD